MKRRWACKCTIRAGKTIKPICGSMGGLEEVSSSIFGWGGGEGPKLFLGQFEGILQADGYTAYDHTGGPKLVHAACWAHARRKVFDALKLSPDDRAAAELVKRIDALFLVDAEARDSDMDPMERHAVRQEKSRPLLDIIKQQMQAAQIAALPASALGKAASYTLSLWNKLTRFLEYPELELSNNLAENSLRGVALGRKNWIPRQRTGRTEGSRHSVCYRELPQAQAARSRIPRLGLTRLG
jgi:hypothetical protein